jgi:ATP-dependent Lon protease
VKQVTQLPGGTMRVVTEGIYRARARSVEYDESGYFYAVTDEIMTKHSDEVLEEAYFRTAREMVRDVFSLDGKIGKEASDLVDSCSDPEVFIYTIASAMRVRLDVKQQLLEEESLVERLKLFERCLNDELEICKIEKKISTTVRSNIDKSQKEYYLREQLKAIHAELGDDGKEADEYRAKIQAKGLPEEVEKKCLKELDRMDKMSSSSPEYTVITTYLDWVLDLPWNEETTDTEKFPTAPPRWKPTITAWIRSRNASSNISPSSN